jgi:hypothetical protein
VERYEILTGGIHGSASVLSSKKKCRSVHRSKERIYKGRDSRTRGKDDKTTEENEADDYG